MYEYLIDLGSIFAVNEEENLKDVCFLKAGEVYCYTVTHEEMCIMAGEEEKMFEGEEENSILDFEHGSKKSMFYIW